MTRSTKVIPVVPQLPADWEARMRADAEKYEEAEKNVGVGQFMSIRGGVLQFQQTPVPGNKMRAVILHSILANAFYVGEYDPNNPQAPVCYAFAETEEEMAPHADAPDKQHEDCASCPNNKFGSAEKGRGKACKNGRRLAVIHADALADPAGIKDTTVAILGLPPTSLPSWASYVKSLKGVTGRPIYGVVTEIAVVPDPKNQFKVTFTLVDKITDKKVLGAVYAKHVEQLESLAFPFPANDDSPKRGGAKKKAPPKNKARPAPANKSRAPSPPPPQQARQPRGASKF